VTASLGSRKDNFATVAGDSAFTDDFSSLLKTSTSAYYGLVLKKHMIPLFCGGILWLDGCLGFEPGMS